MNARILIISLLLLMAVAASAFAQQGPAQAQGQARPEVARIVTQLGLTKDQAKQIRDIVQKFHQDVQAVVKSNATEADKKAQVKDLRDKAGSAITALLSDDQKAKAEKMHLVDLLLAPPRVGRAVAGIMFALSRLDLTDQQKSTIKGITNESETAAKAIRDDSSLDRPAKQAKLSELRKSTEAKVMAVLTPEQQQKLKAILAKEREAGKGRAGAK